MTRFSTDRIASVLALSFVSYALFFYPQPNALADVMYGTEQEDKIGGTIEDDYIQALGGEDDVAAGPGNDIVLGGLGWDGPANTTLLRGLHGNEGNDIIIGGPGNDELHGSDGNDWLFGGTDNDALYGENGNDIMFVEETTGRRAYEADHNSLDGGPGDDVMIGGSWIDDFAPGPGKDYINCGPGEDIVRGYNEAEDFALVDCELINPIPQQETIPSTNQTAENITSTTGETAGVIGQDTATDPQLTNITEPDDTGGGIEGGSFFGEQQPIPP